LGEGGFGTVYSAWDERLRRRVAVKVLESASAGRRVLREAQAAARLNHPGIVTLYELGSDGDRSYLVSELVEGAPLRERVIEGRLSDRDVALVGAELCDALAHAHGRGVVHRDVKPENVILAGPDDVAPPRAMLTDFGVAAVLGAEALTRTGEVVGTLAYMAPEQAEGLEAGPEADLYALALVLYECWAGENPVARSSPAETARAIGEPPPPLRAIRPDLPLPLCETIDATLSAEPHERPGAQELRAALHGASAELDATAALPLPEREPREPSRRGFVARAGVAALAAAAVVALAAGAPLPGLALTLAVLVWVALAITVQALVRI
jgi:serine/threonine protein kinase